MWHGENIYDSWYDCAHCVIEWFCWFAEVVSECKPRIAKEIIQKNIERHTANTIVSWPNTKQWVIVHISDLIMIIRQSIYILSIITTEMGKLKRYSPTYCIMDKGENMLNLTRQNISDRHFISSMPSDKFAQWWLWDGVLYKQTSTICKKDVSDYLHSS